jgi:hypothetical protein
VARRNVERLLAGHRQIHLRCSTCCRPDLLVTLPLRPLRIKTVLHVTLTRLSTMLRRTLMFE